MRKAIITKDEIIKAAAKVFSTKGLENATVDDIAREAGIAKGSIYLYFKSRDDILLEGIRYFAEERIGALKELLQHFKTAESKLKALMKANKKMAEAQPEIFFMNYALMISTHKNIKGKGAGEYFKKYIDFVEEIIGEGIKTKEFRKGNARIMALMLILTQDMGHIFNDVNSNIIATNGIADELLKLIITS